MLILRDVFEFLHRVSWLATDSQLDRLEVHVRNGIDPAIEHLVDSITDVVCVDLVLLEVALNGLVHLLALLRSDGIILVTVKFA